MGYRSIVKVFIIETPEVQKHFGTLEDIIDNAEKVEPVFGNKDDVYIIGSNSDGVRVLKADFIGYKWYDSYSFVQYWDNIFNILDSEDKEELYLFVRLGESTSDFETRGSLGDAYDFTDFEIDIDFQTDEFKRKLHIEKLITQITKEFGLNEIIGGSTYYSKGEIQMNQTENSLEKYLSINHIDILNSLIK